MSSFLKCTLALFVLSSSIAPLVGSASDRCFLWSATFVDSTGVRSEELKSSFDALSPTITTTKDSSPSTVTDLESCKKFVQKNFRALWIAARNSTAVSTATLKKRGPKSLQAKIHVWIQSGSELARIEFSGTYPTAISSSTPTIEAAPAAVSSRQNFSNKQTPNGGWPASYRSHKGTPNSMEIKPSASYWPVNYRGN